MKKVHKTGKRETPASASAPWRRHLYPAGVGAAALGLFLLTLAPTVTAEDSGELIAAVWHFGIPHPPGYPLWTLLCGIFVHVLPFGEIAWRANLFSAVCSAGAAVVAYAAIRELNLPKSVAAAASLVWIWSAWSWSQSVITEVYGLNSLLTTGVLWCGLRWHRTGSTRPLVVASLLLGLGMSNHHIIALSALAVILWILLLRPGLLRRWRLVLSCVGALVVGLLPYVYLPIRALAKPPMNWGDPSTPLRFWEHVTRHAYGAIGPTASVEPRSLERLGPQLWYLGESICDDLTPWLACAALLGLLVLAKRNRPLLLLVALWLICTGPLFTLLANHDLDRSSRWLMRVFLIPVSLALVFPLAFLLEYLRGVLFAKLGDRRWLAGALVALLVCAGPAVQVAAHWGRCDYSNYWYARDHARNLLQCMAPDALVFSYKDYNTFPLVYLSMVEGLRADVLMACYTGRVRLALFEDRPPDSEDSPVAWVIEDQGRPTYCTVERTSPVPSARFVPAGILYHLLPEGASLDGTELLDRCTYRNLDQPTVRDFGADLIIAQYHIFKGSHDLEHGDRQTALEHLEIAAELSRGMKGNLNKIGAVFFEHGLVNEAIDHCEEAARLDPRYAETRWNLFQIYRGLERWEDVKRQLIEIVEGDPRESRACAELGFLLYRFFDDHPGALRSWREALRRNPDLPKIKAIVDRYDQQQAGHPPSSGK